MPPNVEKGLYSNRKPPWWEKVPGLGQSKDDAIVLPEGVYPESYETARRLVADWEVEVRNVGVHDGHQWMMVEGWKGLHRNDTGQLLSIQQDSYKIITLDEFGDVIDAIVGLEKVQFETFLSLDHGRQIVALIKFPTPLHILKDESYTFTYLAASLNFDGRGGLKGIPTNMRVECQNMARAAEMIGDMQRVSFTIRHTKNWKDRVSDAATYVQMARADGKKYEEIVNEMAAKQVGYRQQVSFVESMYPLATDMTDTVKKHVMNTRENWEECYVTKNQSIAGTAYGLWSASVEVEDHYRRANSTSSYVRRTALSPNLRKQQAMKLALAV